MKNINKKFVIIDGNALIHRSFHALPPTLAIQDGTMVNAVYGFTAFILKSFLELEPEFVVLTLDRPAPTFRHKQYAEYKATRVKAPDELYAQIPLVKEIAKALDIPIFEQDGLEADDLIGCLVKRAEKETDWHNIIITGDMDTLQLVSERTSVYTMGKGLNESKIYTPEEVKKRYSFTTKQLIDYKGLRGDPSDNIPGVKGIGEKGATELLKKFYNLEGIYQALDNDSPEIKARTKELLRAGKESAFFSRSLATIDTEAKLEFAWEDFRLSSFDEEKAKDVFIKFEFKSLLNKLHQIKNLKHGVKVTESGSDEKKIENKKLKIKINLINNDTDFKNFLLNLGQEKSFALSLISETDNPFKSKLFGLAFSFKNNEAHYLALNNLEKKLDLFNFKQENNTQAKNLQELKSILQNEKILKYGHDLKTTQRFLFQENIKMQGLSFDTLIASYLLHPEILNHDLGDLILQELTEEKTSLQDLQGNGKNKLSLSEIKQEAITEFATTEANYIWRLQSILLKKLEEAKLLKLFNKIEMPLITVLAKMEEQGIILNPKPLKSLAKILAKKLEDLSKKIHKISQEDFNINSPKQLQAILFDKLAITSKGLKKTKTGISTADNELEKIKDQHEIIPLIKSYREVSKLQNTYVLALPELINKKDGRLHTNFKQTVASTGRLSSATPNLQNIPTRSAEGREIRRAFEAQKGYRLLGLDYSQIELRLAAHLSKDQKMIKAFLHQEDIHSATAAAINNVKLSEVTKEMRQAAKATNFGILYGQGPHGLSQAAGISYVEARAFIDRYFEVYPNIKKMMDKNIKTAINRGYAETIFKRRRPLPELKSSLMQIKKAGERMAMNMPIQGSAADMIKKAMINIDEIIKNQESEIRLLLQIHDELIFEIRADKLEKYQAIISKLMSEVIKLSVPIIVDSKSAKTWADLK